MVKGNYHDGFALQRELLEATTEKKMDKNLRHSLLEVLRLMYTCRAPC